MNVNTIVRKRSTTDAQDREIRRLHFQENATIEELALRYGVSASTISKKVGGSSGARAIEKCWSW